MSRDDLYSPGDPAFRCRHGVMSDQPCGWCMQEDHTHPSLEDALACGECQQEAQAALRAAKRSEAPSEAPESLSRRVGELEQWWLAMANEEIERTVPKAIEYGSTDLDEIGRQMLAAGLRDTHETSTEELGIYFYMVGKMARWTDAIRTGRRVSDDTLFDLGVYVRMVQRIRSAGGWPGINERTEG